MRITSLFRSLLRRFAGDNKANVAMMFGLTLVPMLVATGAGIDFARGVMARQQMLQALDAAALAVGNATSKPAACSSSNASTKAACEDLRKLAQKYFEENYDATANASYGTPSDVGITIDGSKVTLTANMDLQLTLLGITPINITKPNVSASSTVVWGQTKLWVALVLDNSGSMDQGDNSGSKMAALKDALNSTSTSSPGLFKILQDAAAAEGDVRVGIVPFANSVRPGWSSDNSYIDWNEWEGYPVVLGPTPDTHKITGFRTNANKTGGIEFAAFGPGDPCPFTDKDNDRRDTYGFNCTSSESNSAGTVDTIADSGSRKGYICPGRDYGTNSVQSHNYQYYNGCFTSTRVSGEYVQITNKSSSATCSNTGFASCTCTGSNSNKYCRVPKWSHSWFSNTRSWSNCVGDRQKLDMQTAGKTGPRVVASKSYDASKDAPGSGDTLFPAVSSPLTCVSSAVVPIPSNWTSGQWDTLKTKVTAMDAGGSTNQGIGMAHGWLLLTPGAPYNSGTSSVPENVTRIIILFSDGLNTQNRWWGDGATENTTEDGYIDDRTTAICQAAKDDKIIVYTIYVHIGSNGNSSTLESCASPGGKYYDLTSSASIKDAFKDIAQKITNLRVAE